MVEAAAILQGQLISAESELHGLETIYTDQNIRVRSLRARIDELRAQLQKLGGEKDTATQSSGTAESSDSGFYPTIRKLPLLGVTYFDLYRKTKIQETVFELLTQQYELAKVQEAKEIPSVKVLDVAVVPTKKSFPPLALMTILGTVFFFLVACTSIFAKRHYSSIDPQDPGKLLAEEISLTVKTRVSGVVTSVGVLLNRLRGRHTPVQLAQNELNVTASKQSQSEVTPESSLSQAAGKGVV